MTTINSIARIETEENLIEAVESLNLDKVKDLMLRFDFNEEILKDLSLNVIEKNSSVELACLLLKNTSKKIKEEILSELRNKTNITNNLVVELQERIDL